MLRCSGVPRFARWRLRDVATELRIDLPHLLPESFPSDLSEQMAFAPPEPRGGARTMSRLDACAPHRCQDSCSPCLSLIHASAYLPRPHLATVEHPIRQPHADRVASHVPYPPHASNSPASRSLASSACAFSSRPSSGSRATATAPSTTSAARLDRSLAPSPTTLCKRCADA